MKLLITGSNGLVGSHFTENFNTLNNNTVILSPDIDQLDITNQDSVKKFFGLHKPNAVIHFAAFTDVSQGELQRNDKKAPCWIVNVQGTANLIEAGENRLAYFIYISTENVFSGLKNNPGPYPEDYPTENNQKLLSWYGWTKREGERIVINNLKNAAIVRICNPVRANYQIKLDYIHKILQLFDTNQMYPMFNDQYLTLTYINEVTSTLEILLDKKLPGIFHVSSTNVFTPFELANLLIDKARGKKNFIKSISIEKYLNDNPSRYPQYGGLKVDKTQKELGIKFAIWEEVIETLAKQL